MESGFLVGQLSFQIFYLLATRLPRAIGQNTKMTHGIKFEPWFTKQESELAKGNMVLQSVKAVQASWNCHLSVSAVQEIHLWRLTYCKYHVTLISMLQPSGGRFEKLQTVQMKQMLPFSYFIDRVYKLI